MVEGMDFGDAVRAMKAGQEVRRKSWRKEWKIAEHNGSLITFIGGPVGWSYWRPSYDDILGEDWEIAQ